MLFPVLFILLGTNSLVLLLLILCISMLVIFQPVLYRTFSVPIFLTMYTMYTVGALLHLLLLYLPHWLIFLVFSTSKLIRDKLGLSSSPSWVMLWSRIIFAHRTLAITLPLLQWQKFSKQNCYFSCPEAVGRFHFVSASVSPYSSVPFLLFYCTLLSST